MGTSVIIIILVLRTSPGEPAALRSVTHSLSYTHTDTFVHSLPDSMNAFCVTKKASFP